MASWKDYVRVATTGNLSPFPPTNLLPVDGVALNAGDRVLVKDQQNASQNGIWVAAAGVAWDRASDVNTSALMTPEMTVRVSEGTSNAHTEWFLRTQNPITLGTTNLFFTQNNVLAELCVNVRDFGAGNGMNDTLTINNVLKANPCVIVPPGEYRVDGTLEVDFSLFLLPGATLIRKSHCSSSTDPVVLLKSNFAALTGSGWVVTENNSPRGVVCVGPPDLTMGSSNINWTRIDGIKIRGVSTGTLNVGLDLDSSEPPPPLGVGSGSNYNGNFSNILIMEVEVGVKIGPYCNAHTFSNVFFYQITKYSYWSIANSENTFFGGFTHGSPCVTVIKLEDALYNLFYGVQAEPGSDSRYFVVDGSSKYCQILGHDNCPNAPINKSDTFTYLSQGYLSLVGLEATVHLPRFGAPYKVVPLQAKEQPNSIATSVAQLTNDFNTLLQNLRDSGVIK